MKKILAALFVFLAASCYGLVIVTLDGRVFNDCEVKKVEREGVRIMHRDGTAFLDYDVLPFALQKQYGWTAAKSAARKAERTAAADAQRIAGENARRADADRAAAIAKEQEQRRDNERATVSQKSSATTSSIPSNAEDAPHVGPENSGYNSDYSSWQKWDKAHPTEKAARTAENSDFGSWLKWGFGALLALVAFGWVKSWVKRAKARQVRDLERGRQDEEVRQFKEYCETHNAFPTVATSILLKDGELAFYDAPSALYEKRAVRHWVSGSIGFRLAKGVYVGSTRGRSVSEQEWGRIDTGTLTITNRRIIFNGGGIDRTVTLANVMAVEPWLDGVEISIEKRQKGMAFGTPNPVLVGFLINYLARGGSPGIASPAQVRNPQLPPGA